MFKRLKIFQKHQNFAVIWPALWENVYKVKNFATVRLSPQEVNHILRNQEFSREFPTGVSAVRACDINQLGSNDPIEDTRNEALCLHNSGFLFGVFDGHAGCACGQVVAKRLFHYIAASLLPSSQLASLNESIDSFPLIETFNQRFEFVDVLRELYANSFRSFVKTLASDTHEQSSSFNVESRLKHACLALDNDLSREALETEKNPRVNMKTLSVAMSGAVAVFAYIANSDLHVANIGDCQAVIGELHEDQWAAKVLGVQHNAESNAEVQRILAEHPAAERLNIIKYDRLFGQLAPLRAFGDFRYKWPVELLKKIAVPHYGESVIPPNYLTPPYLTAVPDIIQHKLTPRDKFLVLATDGLWDFISPLQVVRLVGEHMRGKTVLTPYKMPKKKMSLGEIHDALLLRRDCLEMRPLDENAATHLMRNALCATEYGLDEGKLAQLLALPSDVSRNFRDDISVTVIYFDTDYLHHCLPT